MQALQSIREQLARMLDWEDAHAGYDAAIRDLAPELRSVRPPGAAHSAWELIEHLRITQRDILDFCRAPAYHELEWPAQYWPASAQPPAPDAWDASVAAFHADRATFQRMVVDPAIDLLALVPHATNPQQTYLRELLVVADHNAYHVAQLIDVRRALGAWQPG